MIAHGMASGFLIWFRSLFKDITFIGVNKNNIHIRAIIEFLSPKFAQSYDGKLSNTPVAFRVFVVREAQFLA